MLIWNKEKSGCVVHEINPETDKTFCKIENGSSAKHLNTSSEQAPSGRRICSICLQIKAAIAQRKNKRVCTLAIPGNKNFLSSDQWAEIRYKAFLKYGRRCGCCGATPKDGARLHVDHIKPKSKYPELALDIDNLQILCADCNRGKGAWDETDFRESEAGYG